MNDFVEQCRSEWKRIRVPEAIANEMAADLDADLLEAAAENVAPEEVLGNGIFDAPAFARSWAAARGVIPPAYVPAARSDGRRIAAIALAVLAVFGVGLLALVLFHPTARTVVVARSGLLGAATRRHPGFAFSPYGVVGQHAGVGAPAGVLILGLLVVALLAACSYLAWHRA